MNITYLCIFNKFIIWINNSPKFSVDTAGGITVISDTATLNFGTIAPNGHQVLTITSVGASLSDLVVLGIPNASMSDHASYVAWVSATNTVSIKCFNFDGSSFDPAAGLFKVKVIK